MDHNQFRRTLGLPSNSHILLVSSLGDDAGDVQRKQKSRRRASRARGRDGECHEAFFLTATCLSRSLSLSLLLHHLAVQHPLYSMARNQEKAQSTLYRFREAQAAELGIAPSSARRPRVASRVTNLRECEKWRGEVLREISRKVSKIQDFGLTDYEVRDVNDEINRLIREKGAWEHQIVALGGANYKRGVPKMLDDSGREVPGTRGYKYFGRAKDLPGVKELLNRSVEEEAEMESFRSLKYKRFANQPPAYYGDDDEEDGLVLAAEEEAEERAWSQGYQELREELGEDAEDLELPLEIPRPKPTNLKQLQEADAANSMEVDSDEQKGLQDQRASTQMSAVFNVFDSEELRPPAVPDRGQVEAMILQAKKRALRQQCECFLGGRQHSRD